MSKKILWAAPACLLDSTSGFAISVKMMLTQLYKNGYDVKILSATTFDSVAGAKIIKEQKSFFSKNLGKVVSINDGNLIHQTYVTKSTVRNQMLSNEEFMWFGYYCRLLDEFKPDLLFFYRSTLLELCIAREAKLRNIATAAYLVNPSYSGKEWIRDLDLILTDTQATVDMYKRKENYELTSVGTFIDKKDFLIKEHKRERVLFINPVLEKGVIFVIQIALMLKEKKSDIVIEIVNSRGNWQDILKKVEPFLGNELEDLPNVVVSENSNDMKNIYSRTRVLLVPSLWHESGSRVIAEAQLNGIPVIASNSGGNSEMIGEGGFILDFPEIYHETPFNKIFDKTIISKSIEIIEKLYDDESLYNEYKQKAFDNASIKHDMEKNTKRLIDVIGKTIELVR